MSAGRHGAGARPVSAGAAELAKVELERLRGTGLTRHTVALDLNEGNALSLNAGMVSPG